MRRPPSPTLFPYTTLFRSWLEDARRRPALAGTAQRDFHPRAGGECETHPDRRRGPPQRWGGRRRDYCCGRRRDRKSTRLNSSHGYISYAVFCLKKKKKEKV